MFRNLSAMHIAYSVTHIWLKGKIIDFATDQHFSNLLNNMHKQNLRKKRIKLN